jgi:hypothetical protein
MDKYFFGIPYQSIGEKHVTSVEVGRPDFVPAQLFRKPCELDLTPSFKIFCAGTNQPAWVAS